MTPTAVQSTGAGVGPARIPTLAAPRVTILRSTGLTRGIPAPSFCRRLLEAETVWSQCRLVEHTIGRARCAPVLLPHYSHSPRTHLLVATTQQPPRRSPPHATHVSVAGLTGRSVEHTIGKKNHHHQGTRCTTTSCWSFAGHDCIAGQNKRQLNFFQLAVRSDGRRFRPSK